MPKSAEQAPLPEAPAQGHDPFAWNPDPEVVVSRRTRMIYFPLALIDREVSAEEVDRWAGAVSPATARHDQHLILPAGVVFLGAYTTSWELRLTTAGHAPTGAPSLDKCLLIQPPSQASAALRSAAGNIDRATGRLRPDRVQAFLRRVVAYHKTYRHPAETDLWSVGDGFDAPELQLIRLSDTFTQRGDAGQHAHATVLATIPQLRSNRHESMTPLGALHDYAARSRSGRPIMEACRSWFARKGLGQ